MNVIFFAVTGVMGVTFLQQGMRIATEREDGQEGIKTGRLIFILWIFLYGFVGSQMAWTLRPFVRQSTEPFMVLEQRGGSFYSNVIYSAGELIQR